mgnify:FL=1
MHSTDIHSVVLLRKSRISDIFFFVANVDHKLWHHMTHSVYRTYVYDLDWVQYVIINTEFDNVKSIS